MSIFRPWASEPLPEPLPFVSVLPDKLPDPPPLPDSQAFKETGQAETEWERPKGDGDGG